jgi:transportin-1
LLPILEGLLRLCLDKNKEVQKSGCSALVTIEEDAKEALIPFLDPIIATLSKAFLLYQRKNLLILYDTIGTLAEAVGNALNQPKYIGTIMPLLLQKYDQCEDDNFDLFSILEVIEINFSVLVR